MKKGRTVAMFILDRSGSMQSIWSDASGALEKFVADQKAAPGELLFSLALFDDKYELRHDLVPLSDVQPLLTGDGPRGSTALVDACCRSIDQLGQKLAAMPEDERPEKVVIAIMTDGMENASREYKSDDLKARIEEQTGKWKWDFLFLGANVDAFALAQSYGIHPKGVLNFQADAHGVDSVMRSVSCCLTDSRTTGGEAFLVNKDERLIDVNSTGGQPK